MGAGFRRHATPAAGPAVRCMHDPPRPVRSRHAHVDRRPARAHAPRAAARLAARHLLRRVARCTSGSRSASRSRRRSRSRCSRSRSSATLRPGVDASRTTSCRRRARRASRSPPASPSRCRRCCLMGFELDLLRDDADRAARRRARRADDGAAAARPDRARARAAAVSGGHRVRAGADRRASAAASRRAPSSPGSARAALFGMLGGLARFWGDVASWSLRTRAAAAARFAIETNPALLGVGYVVGVRIALVMLAGGMLSYWVLIPAIHIFGPELTSPLVGRRHDPRARDDARAGAQRLPALRRRGRGRDGRTAHAAARAADDRARVPRGSSRRSRRASGVRERTDHDLSMRSCSAARWRSRSRSALAPPLGLDAATASLVAALRLLLRDGVEPHHGRDRLVVEPDLGHDGGDAARDLPALRRGRTDRRLVQGDGARDRGARVRRREQRRHHLAGSEDRLPGRRDAARAADRDRWWASSRARSRSAGS